MIGADLSFPFPCGFYTLYVILDEALNIAELFYSWMFPELIKLQKIINSFLFKGRRGEELPHLLPALCLCSIARVPNTTVRYEIHIPCVVRL